MIRKLSKVNHLKIFIGAAVGAVLLIFYFSSYKPNHSSTKVVVAGKSTNSQVTTSQPAIKNINGGSGMNNVGGATDTHGSSQSSPPSSQWTSSASGVITVKSPAPNATLKSGDTISGSSSASEINYRLSDDKVGVIAQGTLTVDSGNFSGILHFQTHGTSGRLDIFTTNAMGVEYNEVQINVGF